MTTVAYRCKMCGREGQARLECGAEELKVLGFNLEVWRSMLTCDRCYDFRDQYKRLIDRIFRLCTAWQFLSTSKRESSRSKMKEKLSDVTKRLVRLIAEHFRQQNVWDEQIVDGLMSEPDKSKAQVAHVYHA